MGHIPSTAFAPLDPGVRVFVFCSIGWVIYVGLGSVIVALTRPTFFGGPQAWLEFGFTILCLWWIVLFLKRRRTAFGLAIAGLIFGAGIQLVSVVLFNPRAPQPYVVGAIRLAWAGYLVRLRRLARDTPAGLGRIDE